MSVRSTRMNDNERGEFFSFLSPVPGVEHGDPRHDRRDRRTGKGSGLQTFVALRRAIPDCCPDTYDPLPSDLLGTAPLLLLLGLL